MGAATTLGLYPRACAPDAPAVRRAAPSEPSVAAGRSTWLGGDAAVRDRLPTPARRFARAGAAGYADSGARSEDHVRQRLRALPALRPVYRRQLAPAED